MTDKTNRPMSPAEWSVTHQPEHGHVQLYPPDDDAPGWGMSEDEARALALEILAKLPEVAAAQEPATATISPSEVAQLYRRFHAIHLLAVEATAHLETIYPPSRMPSSFHLQLDRQPLEEEIARHRGRAIRSAGQMADRSNWTDLYQGLPQDQEDNG